MTEAIATRDGKARYPALKRTVKVSSASLRQGNSIFQVRATRAIENLVAILDPAVLGEAASAPTDVEVLVTALQQPVVLTSMLQSDPLAKAKLLGQIRRKELLEA